MYSPGGRPWKLFEYLCRPYTLQSFSVKCRVMKSNHTLEPTPTFSPVKIPSKKKYKERRRKGAPLIMSRSSKQNSDSQRTEVRRYSDACDWGAPNRVIWVAPFLFLFWSSFTTPLLELCYYSSFGASLLYTPLLELSTWWGLRTSWNQ